MKNLLIGFLIFASQAIYAQQLELRFYCKDVKIISEHTGDTVNRCELIFDKKESLAKLGCEYAFDERWGEELRDLYHYGDDIFHYPHDTLIKTVGFDIFTNKFKLLFDNQFLVQVGNHIDSCFKQYAPIPIQDDSSDESSVIIYYKSLKEEDYLVKNSFMAITYKKKDKIIIHIADFMIPDF